jgi:hypothetical protein
VRLRDGRTFVLNGATNVALERIDADAVVLNRAGESIRIAWTDLAAIKLPRR